MSKFLHKSIRPVTQILLGRILTLRNFASRRKCAPYDDPKCSKNTLRKQKPCPFEIRLEASNSIWENPECCKDPCPKYSPRFDELYYLPNDKAKRTYQQTWVSCPDFQIREKKICAHELLKFPSMEKRNTRNRKRRSSCPLDTKKLCMGKKDRKCPSVIIKGCPGSRTPPKCKREREPSNCLRECTPYPSYSECLRKKLDRLHPIECKCLDRPMMCEMWMEMKRRMAILNTP